MVFLGIVIHSPTYTQTNPAFNVNLMLDYSAAEQTIQLFEDQLFNTQSLAELRGNIIAGSTAGYIAHRASASLVLKDYLDSVKYHESIKDDIYHLEDSKNTVVEIKELLEEIKKHNFSIRVVSTIEQIFPSDANVHINIPLYIVALGHENVDAFVRRIIWHGKEPEFVGENQGELTIVINLAHAVNYGPTLNERYVALLGVVAHEAFHAAFGAYKETSPRWKSYTSAHHTYFDDLLDLTHNEGIAYYLSLDQRGRGYLPRDWSTRTQSAFINFNKNSTELLSQDLATYRASELLRTANLSGYWDSYGSMTGMFIAREIDLRLGRASLIETIKNGPRDFFQKYIALTAQDSNLPKLADKITAVIAIH
jgi:hypothetical protein